jgi:hypothetical protein
MPMPTLTAVPAVRVELLDGGLSVVCDVCGARERLDDTEPLMIAVGRFARRHRH